MRTATLKAMAAFAAAALMLLAPVTASAGYSAVFKPFYGRDGGLWLAIRAQSDGSTTRYLAVDTLRLTTAMVDAPELSRGAKTSEWKKTRLARALGAHGGPADDLQSGGLRHGAGKGLFITIDLCPSLKSMDYRLFEAIEEVSRALGSPVPVAVAVSGKWMQRHADELEYLLGLEKKGAVSITWVNHTDTHPYDEQRPLDENFLLIPGTDLGKETLGAEQAMIARGIVPSPFFRFPGLVADKGLFKGLKRLSLIPVGADAWLAKGQKPVEGSIILVHGNGNEPDGVRRLVEFIEGKKADIASGRVRFLPLSEAVSR